MDQESSWEYKLDRYTGLPSRVLFLYAKLMQTLPIVQSGWQFSKNEAGHYLNRGSFIFYKLSAVPHLSVWPQKYVAGSKAWEVLRSFTVTERVSFRKSGTGN